MTRTRRPATPARPSSSKQGIDSLGPSDTPVDVLVADEATADADADATADGATAPPRHPRARRGAAPRRR